MNILKEYREQIAKDAFAAFKEHTVRVIAGDPKLADWEKPCVMEWRKDKSSNYLIRIIINGPWLCFMGDCGEAIHQWSTNIDGVFLASIEFDYFMSKCRASESKDCKTFDGGVAMAQLAHFIADNPDDDFSELSRFLDGYIDQFEFHQTINRLYDRNEIDPETASSLSRIGFVYTPMSQYRFIGLQLALNKLAFNSIMGGAK